MACYNQANKEDLDILGSRLDIEFGFTERRGVEWIED